LHLDTNSSRSCFIHTRIHFDKFKHIRLCRHLHKVTAIKDTESHKVLLMDQQMYLINTAGHTFYLPHFHNNLKDRTNHKFLSMDYQTQGHYIVKGNTLKNDQRIMVCNLYDSLYMLHHRICNKVQDSKFHTILLSPIHTIKSNGQHKLMMSFQQSKEQGRIVGMCDYLR